VGKREAFALTYGVAEAEWAGHLHHRNADAIEAGDRADSADPEFAAAIQ